MRGRISLVVPFLYVCHSQEPSVNKLTSMYTANLGLGPWINFHCISCFCVQSVFIHIMSFDSIKTLWNSPQLYCCFTGRESFRSFHAQYLVNRTLRSDEDAGVCLSTGEILCSNSKRLLQEQGYNRGMQKKSPRTRSQSSLGFPNSYWHI